MSRFNPFAKVNGRYGASAEIVKAEGRGGIMSAAYIYKAALYCPACADLIKRGHSNALVWPRGMKEDSEYWPQGPYPNGGGEADCPQHCDACHMFLENPLTGDGENYVREKIAEGHDAHATHNGLKIIWRNPVVKEWAEFYDMLPGEVS